MSQILSIARAELIYMRRSRLTLIAAGVFALCLCFAALTSAMLFSVEQTHRQAHQSEADAIFASQPDRHPHRMVHYGQYVFRSPAPLAAIDPGLDAYGGTTVFLEGHRQNAPMFAGAAEGKAPPRFGQLTPAFVLQVLAPLLIILAGFSLITRERESGTLSAAMAQGVSLRTLALGKSLVLGLLIAACLLPVAALGILKVARGEETAVIAATVCAAYGGYLLIWALMTVSVSMLVKRGATALLALSALWLASTVLAPRLAGDVAAQIAPLKTAFERDLSLQVALNSLGDSHDPKDPIYGPFRQKILAKYGVSKVEDLPVNYRGLLAQEGERRSGEVLARFNREDMDARLEQQRWVESARYLSPMVATQSASQSLVGTDLRSYHRFLAAAEEHRMAFVQTLNGLHATELDYKLDKMRSVDVEAAKATRVASDTWANLPQFSFTQAPSSERLAAAIPQLVVISLWCGVLMAVFFWSSRQPAP
ncbi:MAG: DUF3526 domain-containing protein [Pseudomonadota bacterium]